MSTPRTDAAIQVAQFGLEQIRYVEPAFARQLERELAAAQAERDALRKDAERWQVLVDLWALGTLTLELNEGGFYKAHIEIPGEGASICIGSAEEIIDSSRNEWAGDARLEPLDVAMTPTLTPEQIWDLSMRYQKNVHSNTAAFADVLQAAFALGQRAGMEEAAKVCEERSENMAGVRAGIRALEANYCAAAIRAALSAAQADGKFCPHGNWPAECVTCLDAAAREKT